jgi:TfoX/Sxy family transcriptional regulator of competence genes
MAYDEGLAERVRELLLDQPALNECRMFGGLAFLINGNMAVVVSGSGGLMLRVDPASCEALVTKTDATYAVMRGKPMTGWLRVGADSVDTKRELAKWVDRALVYTQTLPAKKPKR